MCSYMMKWKVKCYNHSSPMLHIPGYAHLLFPSEINTHKRGQLWKKKKNTPKETILRVFFLETDNSLETRWLCEAFAVAKNVLLWEHPSSIIPSTGADYLVLLWVLTTSKKQLSHVSCQSISMNLSRAKQLTFSQPFKTQSGKVTPVVFSFSTQRCSKLFESLFSLLSP